MQHVNGLDITQGYKIPNLSNLTKVKNEVKTYIKQLLKDENQHLINEILAKKVKISQHMIIIDHDNLTDIFLQHDGSSLEYSKIQPYFNKDGWIATKSLIEKKEKFCTCLSCGKVCLIECIRCSTCQYWYHYDCMKVSHYHRSCKSKRWFCKQANCK